MFVNQDIPQSKFLVCEKLTCQHNSTVTVKPLHCIPGEERQGVQAQEELQAMEAEEHSGEDELQAQDEGLEEEEVDAKGRTGQEKQQ